MLKKKANRPRLLNILTFQLILFTLSGTQFDQVGFHGHAEEAVFIVIRFHRA
jgi:hypothetical protein